MRTASRVSTVQSEQADETLQHHQCAVLASFSPPQALPPGHLGFCPLAAPRREEWEVGELGPWAVEHCSGWRVSRVQRPKLIKDSRSRASQRVTHRGPGGSPTYSCRQSQPAFCRWTARPQGEHPLSRRGRLPVESISLQRPSLVGTRHRMLDSGRCQVSTELMGSRSSWELQLQVKVQVQPHTTGA